MILKEILSNNDYEKLELLYDHVNWSKINNIIDVYQKLHECDYDNMWIKMFSPINNMASILVKGNNITLSTKLVKYVMSLASNLEITSPNNEGVILSITFHGLIERG